MAKITRNFIDAIPLNKEKAILFDNYAEYRSAMTMLNDFKNRCPDRTYSTRSEKYEDGKRMLYITITKV